MHLDVGCLLGATAFASYGFVAGLFQPKVFVHRSKASFARLKQALSREYGPSDTDLRFWYIYECAAKGPAVVETFENLSDVPYQVAMDGLEWLLATLDGKTDGSISNPHTLPDVINDYLSDRRIKPTFRKRFLETRHFNDDPGSYIGIFDYGEIWPFLSKLSIESRWQDVSRELPERFSEITTLARGTPRLRELQELRTLRKQETAQRLIAQDREDRKVEKAREEARLVTKFREDLKGIRNDALAHELCLTCGTSEYVRSRSSTEWYWNVCQQCGNQWYFNTCWCCKHGNVDSRDPETPKCDQCGWFICNQCGACHQDGCDKGWHRTGGYPSCPPKIPLRHMSGGY